MTSGERIAAAQVTEVAGIPTVWAEAPGPYAGGLVVRLGRADETLATHGITHMLEHLALFGLDRPGEHSNGQVDTTTLAIHATGSPEEVSEFLTKAARQLADPPVSRLEDEKGVLRAEAANKPRYTLAQLLAWRWGVRGYGLEAAEELGLENLTAASVHRWARTRVGRRNAVLWFHGPPPAGLRIGLPDGEPRPAPDPYPSALPAFPSYFVADTGTVVLHGLVRRSMAASALVTVLRTRLVDDLRVTRAAAYSPEAFYRPLTGEVASITIASDIVDGKAHEVGSRILALLAELADRPATQAELDSHRRDLRRHLAAPGATAGLVTSGAWNLLNGRPVETAAALLAEAEEITPDEVEAAGRELFGTALAQLPSGLPLLPGWQAAPLSPSAPITEGTTFREIGGPARLVISPAGVTLRGTDNVTVRRELLDLVGHWDDGGRVLIGGDGVRLAIEPTLWRRGRRAMALIDAMARPETIVPLRARPASEVPRVTWRRRLRSAVPYAYLVSVVTIGLGVALAALISALVDLAR